MNLDAILSDTETRQVEYKESDNAAMYKTLFPDSPRKTFDGCGTFCGTMMRRNTWVREINHYLSQ